MKPSTKSATILAKKGRKDGLSRLIKAVRQAGGKPYKQDKHSVWVEVPADGIRKALETVQTATERISDLSVYDAGNGSLEVMYRFFVSGAVLTLKTLIPAHNPRLPTCTGLFPGALLFEREQHEMSGVLFYGHPGLDKVLFADSTPERPLRKKIADVAEKPTNKEVKDAGKQGKRK